MEKEEKEVQLTTPRQKQNVDFLGDEARQEHKISENYISQPNSKPIQRRTTKRGALNRLNQIQGLFRAIGKEGDDAVLLGNIYISREDISYTISDSNHYYTADFINLLLTPFGQNGANIKVYPAITTEQLKKYSEKIESQKQDYGFIPLNVAYDKSDPKRKNHWVALVIHKPSGFLFYLDPAQKNTADHAVNQLKIELEKHFKYQFFVFDENPIDFQQKEKNEGFIRHCGVYVIEIFAVFSCHIQKNTLLVVDESSKQNVHSVTIQAALSCIPCGEAEAILELRGKHIDQAYSIIDNIAICSLSNIGGGLPMSDVSDLRILDKNQNMLETKEKTVVSPPDTIILEEKALNDTSIIRDDFFPKYIEVFFNRYEGGLDIYSKVYQQNLMVEQREMGGKGIGVFTAFPPKPGSFLATFHQSNDTESFNTAGEFCKQVKAIILDYERYHMYYKDPGVNNKCDKRWNMRHYELLCLKYLVVESADKKDERELKEFIEQLILSTDDKDNLVDKLRSLIQQCLAGTLKLRRIFFANHPGGVIMQLVEELSAANAWIRKNRQEKSDLSKSNIQLKASYDELLKENQWLKDKNIALSIVNKNQADKIVKLSGEHNHLIGEHQNLLREYDVHIERYNKLSLQNNKQRDTYLELLETQKKEEQKYKERQIKHEAIASQAITLTSEYAQLKGEHVILVGKDERRKKKYHGLLGKHQLLQDQHQKLETERQYLKDECDRLSTEKNRRDVEYNKLLANQEKLKSEANLLSVRFVDQQRLLAYYREENKNLEKTIESLENGVDKLEKRMI